MNGQPRTNAGKRLDGAWPGTHLDRLAWQRAIVAIEHEAALAAPDEALRTAAEALLAHHDRQNGVFAGSPNDCEQARDLRAALRPAAAPAREGDGT